MGDQTHKAESMSGRKLLWYVVNCTQSTSSYKTWPSSYVRSYKTQILSKARTQSSIWPCFSSEVELTLTMADLPKPYRAPLCPSSLSSLATKAYFEVTFTVSTTLVCEHQQQKAGNAQNKAILGQATRAYVASCLHPLRRVFYSLFRKTSAPLCNPSSWSISLPLMLYLDIWKARLISDYSDTDLDTWYFNNAFLEPCTSILRFKNLCLPKHWSMLCTAPLNCFERLLSPTTRTGNRYKKAFWFLMKGKNLVHPFQLLLSTQGCLEGSSGTALLRESSYTLVRAN